MFRREGSSPFLRTIRNHNIDTKNIGIMAFLLPKWGILPFFIGFIAKIEACRDGFRPCKPFLLIIKKYKSFTLYPFRSIYGESFNFYILFYNMLKIWYNLFNDKRFLFLNIKIE